MNVNGIYEIRASSRDTLTFSTNVLRGKAGGAYISVDFGEAKRSLNIWIWVAGLIGAGGDPGAVESTAILKSVASTALWFQGFNLGWWVITQKMNPDPGSVEKGNSHV